MIVAFITDNLRAVLIAAIIVTRIIDILCTYIVSPRLLLETNPVVRKFRWPSGILTLLLAVIPLFSVEPGIVILAVSLISSSRNIRKIWMMRTIGEERYLKMIVECVKANGIARISLFEFFSALFWVFLALFRNRQFQPVRIFLR
ncbi:MAG: hypothetical protein JW881_06690 [Spirochaetales bacterium]|nr:hypothetical protein [Spirochaetales bacterium]